MPDIRKNVRVKHEQRLLNNIVIIILILGMSITKS